MQMGGGERGEKRRRRRGEQRVKDERTESREGVLIKSGEIRPGEIDRQTQRAR